MKKISPIFLRVILCVCLLGYIFCRDATAETATFHRPDIEYPTGAVTVICPYAAGGGTDLLARVFAEFATKKNPFNPFFIAKSFHVSKNKDKSGIDFGEKMTNNGLPSTLTYRSSSNADNREKKCSV